MKRLLRLLLVLHFRHRVLLWTIIALLTGVLGLGVMRIERRLDLMSLLPVDHPIVKASIEAGVGQQEILWLAAPGNAHNLKERQQWAEALVERLFDAQGGHASLNGMSSEGRIAPPCLVPGPKGVALWPALLAAGSLMDGDAQVGRLVTEHLYGLAPLLLGNRLAPLTDPDQLAARLRACATHLASPDPLQARRAALDPLDLMGLWPEQDSAFRHVQKSAKGFPFRLRTGYLETRQGEWVLVPLMVDFASGDAAATGRVLAWLGNGAMGPLPKRVSLHAVEEALQVGIAHRQSNAKGSEGPLVERHFPIQATGAHAIAFWEAQRLGREVVWGLALSFVLIGLVYWVGFRTLVGYGYVIVPLLLGMFWALGLTGWLLGRLNLMAAAFGAVLLGVGDDVGILVFSRYRDERLAGKDKYQALRAALLGTGPGVIAASLATSMAFLACLAAPFPGFRDLGLTAGLGLLACLVATFLVLPSLLLWLDKGRGAFRPRGTLVPSKSPRRSLGYAMVTVGLVLVAALGLFRLRWEEDLRRFRQAGNPALTLQTQLGNALGAGLQPLAIQIPLDQPQLVARRWNGVAAILKQEGITLPQWNPMNGKVQRTLGSQIWFNGALSSAAEAGLDPLLLERPFAAFKASMESPLEGLRGLQHLLGQPRPAPSPSPRFSLWHEGTANPQDKNPHEYLTLPLRLSEAAQDRVEASLEALDVRLVGNRPLFQAVKTVARESLQQVLTAAFVAVIAVVGIFGRRWRFILPALLPILASQLGVLGGLGWTGEPLTFLSVVAIPVALGVSVDTALNLLHRFRQDRDAIDKVAKVNAVCAGTTLAGFGGLVFSGYRGLRGLGLACVCGTALALLVTQWLLPWILERSAGERSS